MNNTLSTRQVALLAGAIALLVVLTPGTARAGILVNTESAKNCTTQVLEQPFTRWLDYFQYTLVPGGNFEKGAPAWTLSGAKVVSGNETHYVRSARDARSLSLGRSGSATSRPVCVGIEYPLLRLFARNRGLPTSTLSVEVLFEDALGTVRSLPIGAIAAGRTWQPTLPLPVVASLLPLLPGERTAIAFRFSAIGIGGDWSIDDVFVDPHRRG